MRKNKSDGKSNQTTSVQKNNEHFRKWLMHNTDWWRVGVGESRSREQCPAIFFLQVSEENICKLHNLIEIHMIFLW